MKPFFLTINQNKLICLFVFLFFSTISPHKLSKSLNPAFQWKFVLVKDSENSQPYQVYINKK